MLPGDLQASVILAIATLFFTLLPPLSDLPVRQPLGLAMVLFVPGYALIAALFPRKDDLDGIERVALSFGLSIAVVPLMGLGLNYTPWGIRLTPVVISISVFTMAMTAAAYFRRMSLPQGMRFYVDFRKGLDSIKSELMAGEKSRLDKVLTILLILSIILSVSALVYVIVTPKQGEKFTEFYILGPKGKAYDYPTHVVSGNSSNVIVGVVNHEYIPVNYTMRLSFDNSTLLQQKVELAHNQTWEHPVSYVLNHPGDEQKLEFLLYKENNFTASYRDLHLWVNVSKNASERASEGPRTASEARPRDEAVELNLVPGNSGSGSDGESPSSAGQIKLSKAAQGSNVSYNITNISELGSLMKNSQLSLSSASSREQVLNASGGSIIDLNPGSNLSESNRSKIAQGNNASYNVTNGLEFNDTRPNDQVGLENSRAIPVKLGGKTPRKSVSLGGINKTQTTALG